MLQIGLKTIYPHSIIDCSPAAPCHRRPSRHQEEAEEEEEEGNRSEITCLQRCVLVIAAVNKRRSLALQTKGEDAKGWDGIECDGMGLEKGGKKEQREELYDLCSCFTHNGMSQQSLLPFELKETQRGEGT